MSILSPIKCKMNCQLVYTRSCFVTFFLKERSKLKLIMKINFKSHFLTSKMIIKSKINQIKIKQEHYSIQNINKSTPSIFVRCVWESLMHVNLYIIFVGWTKWSPCCGESVMVVWKKKFSNLTCFCHYCQHYHVLNLFNWLKLNRITWKFLLWFDSHNKSV